MVSFAHVITVTAGPETHVTDIRALVTVSAGAGLRVYGLTGAEGGLSLWRPVQGLGLREALYLPPVTGVGAAYGLRAGEKGGAPYLFAHGAPGAGLRALPLDGLGDPDEGAAQLGPRDVTLAAMAVTGGRLWAATPGSGDLVARVFDAAGVGAPVAQVPLWEAALPGQGVMALSALADGRVIAAGQGADGPPEIALVRDARVVQRIGAAEGLAVSGHMALSAPVAFDGADWVLASAAASSSVALLQVTAEGLRLADQVGDTRDTRFQGTPALAVVEMAGRVFVLAGGADDGVTLMTLLPGGRLLHLGTLADTAVTRLGNVGALALAPGADGAALEVFAAGQDGPGLSWLRIGLGALAPVLKAGEDGGALAGDGRGDMLAGGAGADRLEGRGGDDILIDGAGADTLSGGPGRDTFVLTADGAADVITDFTPGEDVLDLSALGRVYGLASLEAVPLTDGLLLRYGEEEIRLYSAGNGPILASDLRDAEIAGLWHTGPGWLAPRGEPAPRDVTGGDRAELIVGGSGADVLDGAGGADTLLGQAGDDLIRGDGFGPAQAPAAAAAVFRLYRAALGRDPDGEGFAHWTGLVASGARGLPEVAAGFVGSAEFGDRYGAAEPDAFVALLYHNVLGRAPGPAAAGYAAALETGLQSRAGLVLEFAQGAEFTAATAAPARAFAEARTDSVWVDDLYRLYRATLGRDPDAEGLLFWAGMLGHGRGYRSVVDGFVWSPEFERRFGETDNAGFVELLYRNVLERAPDAAGRAFWEGALDRGTSRAAVVEGFAQSVEFRAATAEAAADWARARLPGDEIRPGTGDDLVFGGIGADRLVLFPGDGGVIFADAEPWDVLRFEGFGYGDAGDIPFTAEGADTVLIDQGLELRLVGLAPEQAAEMVIL